MKRPMTFVTLTGDNDIGQWGTESERKGSCPTLLCSSLAVKSEHSPTASATTLCDKKLH